MKFVSAGIAGLMALGASAWPVAAEVAAPQSFRADYSISILGLNIARTTFRSTIEGDRFELTGSLSSSGIAKIFDNTKGTTSVNGRFGEALAKPDSYLLNYISGDKKKKTEITFANGRVSRTENVPPLKKRAEWVGIGADDLAAVADPISATMVRASSLKDVCNHTLRVYDGELRADLALSLVGIGPAEAAGFSGDAVTCRARFLPVGGYKPGHKSLEYLKNKSKILIAFAQLGTTGIYAPIRATAGTEIGTLTITARRFEAVK
ncbi:MAG: DUF3108 domain-containing protein [Mesorhizobium sp.]|nr:DUF3108 domain-containing protein [Mesorhizobium sp.]